jgi:hypothetical protein
MLEQLTHLSKRLGAVGTLIRKVGDLVVVIPVAIGQLRNIRQVTRHGLFGLGKLVDLVSGIVLSSTARAKAAFDVLDGVGARLETSLSTDGTSDISRTMHLHVHVQIILIVKGTVANAALVGRGVADSVDTVSATRPAVAFGPLVLTELAARAILSTVRTMSSHGRWLLFLFGLLLD